jgi:hypothetical protein
MYSQLKAWKASPSAMARAVAGGAVDLGKGEDLAHVMAGVEAATLEAFVVGLSLRAEGEELHQQSLLARGASLCE